MMRIAQVTLFFFLLISTGIRAQQVEVIQNYIIRYKDLAMAEMQRSGVPASITLAQGIHESGAGLSELAVVSNNHFGIKCKSNWTGESVKHDDDAKGECFRKYPSAEDSYKDHSNFLKNTPRYSELFGLDPADYEAWANGLRKAGYATNPKYPQVLIKLIEDYHLQDYTVIALGKMHIDDEKTGMGGGQTDAVPTPVFEPATGKPAEISMKAAPVPAYPEGVFRINDTKVVYVRKGTSFLALAQQYNTDLTKIFEFNEIPVEEAAIRDQLVFLQRKRKTGQNQFHIVQPGETLHDIAQLEAIRLDKLLELNRLSGDVQPSAGEQLSLQHRSAEMPKLVIKQGYSINPASNNSKNK